VSDYFERIERQLVGRVEAGVPHGSRYRPRLNLVAPALSALVAVAIAIVFLSVHGPGSPGSRGGGGVELVYRAESTAQTPKLTTAALSQAVAVMRIRVKALGVSGASFRIASSQITVKLPARANQARAEAEVGTTARFFFYDWEANALTPNGKTVASQLLATAPDALAISQGGPAGPGAPGAGSMSLYDAVKLAAKQPASYSSRNGRLGSQYYLFGEGGSAACSTAARFYGVEPAADHEHCLLSGPDTNAQALSSGLPPGVNASQGDQLIVKQGTVVLQAVPSSFSNPPTLADPTAQFYVLKDNVALFGNEITNPQESTDAGGNPDVKFGFTATGQKEFQSVTATIAKRGNIDSPVGQTLDQHFAVALDNLLITVPSIDFKTFPFGIPGSQGADITAGLTRVSARELASELRLSTLPIGLKLIATKPLAANG
jgi:SecD/SecF fusion protein